MANIKNAELETNSFEELSDADLMAVVGGTDTVGQVKDLVAGVPDAVGSELQQKRYAEQAGSSVENILTGANLFNGTAGTVRNI